MNHFSENGDHIPYAEGSEVTCTMIHGTVVILRIVVGWTQNDLPDA